VRVFVSLIAIVLGLEVGLNLIRPASLQYYRDLKSIHVYDPEYRVGLTPNHSVFLKHHAGLWSGQISINSIGLRHKSEIDSNKRYFACLGDSLTMGFGVSDEYTYCNLLDQKISKLNTPLHSMNLGVDAFGSWENYYRLKRYINKLKNIDTVLFFISPNDFQVPPSMRAQGIQSDDENYESRKKNPSQENAFFIQFELTRYSYLLQALKLAYENSILQFHISRESAKSEWKESGLTSGSKELIHYFKNSFYYNRKNDCKIEDSDSTECFNQKQSKSWVCIDFPKVIPPLPNSTLQAYEAMIALSKQHSVELVPVLVPSQLEELYCESKGKFHELGMYRIQAREFFLSRGIQSIDLISYTRNMCGNQIITEYNQFRTTKMSDYYIPNDGHLTNRGNQWVADSLLKEMEKIKK
jgi:hypothetical protein